VLSIFTIYSGYPRLYQNVASLKKHRLVISFRFLEGIHTYAIRCKDTVSYIFNSVVTIDINRIYIKICSILKYEIEESMCIMFDLSSMTILLDDEDRNKM